MVDREPSTKKAAGNSDIGKESTQGRGRLEFPKGVLEKLDDMLKKNPKTDKNAQERIQASAATSAPSASPTKADS